jgi:D-arabinose 1-dehydrogenase-like Zn-dependent alcohol dehydrogenase
VSLRGEPVVHETTLPDGRHLAVRVAVAADAYIPRRDLTTVALELVADGRVEATVNTLLAPEQVNEARKLARVVAVKLESGELQPTASAIEPLADSIP